MTERPRLGFFTRLLDDAPAGERYRLASEQIEHAESLGFHSAWVAQHHFSADEGGLPSPFVFLSSVAARTNRIRLATGIVTLPLEDPVRTAEDAAVLDALSDGRLELGVGSGGTPSSFAAFSRASDDRRAIFAEHLATLRGALRGDDIAGSGNRLYPAAPGLDGRIWQATFSAEGGRRAGAAGDGLMLSRTQPRPAEAPRATLAELQQPIVDAYLAALPAGARPRILASRTVFAADDRDLARSRADRGLRRAADRFRASGHDLPSDDLDDLLAALDTSVGTADDVIEQLAADTVLAFATDVAVQVHSVDPPHAETLRSLELVATVVAPALGLTVA
ncbi:putative FMN-dependent luciferase-like monooxygenase [Agromyces atrinae]|uniref:putative FMN-dependent luciferase-like monooxygenase n=1 Tax=Agromyces atrinae TaxID=592376 RepID=UPI001F59F835|nr:putative FMN-dependent luciferase-like monooxygenase [Agromyces atrinae]MCI2956493.1 putative FMN-dependent luciferase-like monooxygenase [Agromyces atrinae]